MCMRYRVLKGITSAITIADVYQSNGIIHVIDTVMLPKA